jgi:phage gpG-like protein
MIALEIIGKERLIDALDDLGLSLRDFRPAFISATREFYAIQKDLFASEGRTGASGQWRRLSKRYAAWKAKAAPGKPILELTGTLRRSLTQPNARYSTRRLTAEEMIVGTSDPKARFHFSGTRRMPKRPPISLTPAQQRRIVKVMRDAVVVAVKRPGFLVLEVSE